ncbi:unnamed protein product [Nezara viridula]|uniref:Uncharacterized protein n=1 Tax=Nezara viridula TaxID=85310 RepID=A0A9P0HKD3_NEZVI|nr:unnamed protein product [Nezara viridula]
MGLGSSLTHLVPQVPRSLQFRFASRGRLSAVSYRQLLPMGLFSGFVLVNMKRSEACWRGTRCGPSSRSSCCWSTWGSWGRWWPAAAPGSVPAPPGPPGSLSSTSTSPSR